MNTIFPLLMLALLFPVEDEGPDLTEIYVTATATERALAEATPMVTVIDAQTIEAVGARNAADALRHVAGLAVSSNSRGGLSTVSIRGGDPNFTLVLIDGVPANNLTYQVGGAFNLESIPASMIERIEIVRGPPSAFYGSSGLAGVVHIMTKRSGGLNLFVEGDDADGTRAGLRAAGNYGKAKFNIGLAYNEARGDDRERYEGLHLHGGVSITFANQVELGIQTRLVGWEGDDYPDSSGGPLLGDGRLRTAENEEMQVAARLNFRDGRGRHHQMRLDLFDHQLDRKSPAIFPVVPASEEHSTYRELGLGYQWALRQTSRLGIFLGADWKHEDADNTSTLDLGFPLPGNYHATRDLAGTYLSMDAQIKRLTLEFTSRLDFPDEAATQWNPRLGLRQRLGNGWSLRGSAARSFKLPDYFALASPAALGGNPELKPETAVGWDAGITYGADHLELSLTWFHNDFENLVDFDFDTFAHVNRGEVQTEGLELSVAWRINDQLKLHLSAMDLETDPDELRNRSDWTASAGLHWQPNRETLCAVDLTGRGRTYDQQIPVADRLHVEGHELLGLTVWRTLAAFKITLRGDNLTNETYERFIGFPGQERRWRLSLGYQR